MINKYACCCDHDVKVSVGLVNDLAIMYMHLHECAQICLYSVVLRITLKSDIICSRKKSFFGWGITKYIITFVVYIREKSDERNKYIAFAIVFGLKKYDQYKEGT